MPRRKLVPSPLRLSASFPRYPLSTQMRPFVAVRAVAPPSPTEEHVFRKPFSRRGRHKKPTPSETTVGSDVFPNTCTSWLAAAVLGSHSLSVLAESEIRPRRQVLTTASAAQTSFARWWRQRLVKGGGERAVRRLAANRRAGRNLPRPRLINDPRKAGEAPKGESPPGRRAAMTSEVANRGGVVGGEPSATHPGVAQWRARRQRVPLKAYDDRWM